MNNIFNSLSESFTKFAKEHIKKPMVKCKDPLKAQVSHHKEVGNQSLQQGMVEEAIMHYTKALNLDPNHYIVYTNRATAFKKHKEYALMYEDASRAVELAPDYFKAHLRKGEAALELGKLPKYNDLKLIDQGIQSLQKALSLCWKMGPGDQRYSQKAVFEKQISRQILKAKKIRWYKQKEISKNDRELILTQLLENQNYISHQIYQKSKICSDQEDSQISSTAKGPAGHQEDSATPGEPTVSLEDQLAISKEVISKIETFFGQQDPEFLRKNSDASIMSTRSASSTSAQEAEPVDIPDYLVCRITDELMDEPVVIESGFTFEKKAILAHFERNGSHCPITREEVNGGILIPNKYIKQATQDFLIQNPWAFEFVPFQRLEDMHM